MNAQSPRILIIDDEPLVARMLAAALTRAGYACTTAANGADALNAAAEESYDLAIVDLNLPDTDGMALGRRLKRAHPRLRVLIVTGDPGDHSQGDGTPSRFPVLAKPFDLRELVERVSGLLGGP